MESNRNALIVLGAAVAIGGYALVASGLSILNPSLYGGCFGALQSLTPGFDPATGTCPQAPAGQDGGSSGQQAGGDPGGQGGGQGGQYGQPWFPKDWPAQPYCGTPPNMTGIIVRLQRPAMAALSAARKSMAAAGHGVPIVVSSYRTCAQQCNTCRRHGCPCPDGCPGTCAPVGKSYHQLGLAVDVSNYSAALPYMVGAGWEHPLPGSDPGHFSFGGRG